MPQCVIGNIKIHIEVPLVLIFFAFIVSDSVKTNLIIFRTCYVTLGYNKSECALLGSKHTDNSTANLEKIVEPYAALVNMVGLLVDGCISAVTCLVIGPWSDRFGRKPILIIPVFGFIVTYLLLALFAVLENLSPWYILLCSIPILVTGGVSSYLTVLLCYITDVTNENNRGMRMGVFEALLSLGIFLGNVSSSYIFAATNYSTVFLLSSACCLLNLLFTMFFIPESITSPESEGRLKGLFQFDNVTDLVKTTFKKRRNYDRCVVLSCVLMLTLFILVINGDGALVFLFLREKFHWSLEQYTLFSAAHNVTWVLGTAVGIYLLHKLLKIPETVMIVIGFISMFIGALVMGLAIYSWQVYAAAFSRALGGVLSPMVRSLVSKIVPNDEIGKVFALIVATESLIGMGGSPIFTAIYNTTISTDAGIFNFVAAGVYVVEILIAIGIILVRNVTTSTTENYSQIVNENDNEERSTVDVSSLS
ncbi:probable peptidoglycan muropeptide transporter SLC46 [Tribolium castaneum]|uniref:Proton-coupled folate transporter-like Protein n=1 Tax=Tribolium castaneum TaxID=7070 RepID=A0A139WEK6_TRICA|nr:PREDICTED: tetracycline resistance protein, class C [Tribolium castaneum]KYB26390.1 Proton-coupled folate transporter-like Protein [Tribolium castaneum]|eukprot:XP_975518.1 PREDICTED: tetracycline resistance protein, class C [Tribolium castaneum]